MCYNLTTQTHSKRIKYIKLLCFGFCLDTGSHHADQAGHKPLSSNNPPASASPVAGTTVMHHHVQLLFYFLIKFTIYFSQQPYKGPISMEVSNLPRVTELKRVGTGLNSEILTTVQ
jgi:hypothetical protein